MSAFLRQAVRSDLSEIWRVRYAVTENTLTPGRLSDDDVIEHLEVIGRGWVIETNGTIAGFAICNAQDGNIWALFVDPTHQGKGFGKRLHDEMLRWLWSVGLRQLWLTTGPGTRAQQFYSLNGWHLAAAEPDGDLRFEIRSPASRPHPIRIATLDDAQAIKRLIERSARQVGITQYTAVQMESALRGTFGLDTQLIRDRSYFVVEGRDGSLIGSGGWSRRRTLFGGDDRVDRESGELDPLVDAAKIRAFFVDPLHLRQGIAAALLARCEAEAVNAGFGRFELIATLTGVAFYTAHGYLAAAPISYEATPGVHIGFVPMSKQVPL